MANKLESTVIPLDLRFAAVHICSGAMQLGTENIGKYKETSLAVY